jgi:hypothetical protein
MQQGGEIVEAFRDLGMIGVESLFADRQRTLEEWPRLCQVALVMQQPGEVTEAKLRDGMLRTKRFLADASARSTSFRAPSKSPWSRSTPARLLRVLTVSGCSAPSAFSRIESARS